MEIVTLIIGIIVGIAAAALLLRNKAAEAARFASSQCQIEIARLTERLDAEKRQGAEKIALVHEAREQLSNQFKALAADILEEKSKRFTEQNQTNLSQLLEPLKVKLTEFKGKVEEVYFQEGKERSALAEQVRQLMALNRQLSDDAHNLTLALKGSSKIQGNWGEMILEKILESSGLRKGIEYDLQDSHTLADGSRLQPDVVIHLPGEKHIVIDAKVSLVAYEEYMNADEMQRDGALKRHLESIRAHIKGLSEKNYQAIHGVKSLDFVIMFIPLEPAFMLASANDSTLWQDAWKRNILLVSPGTLLFVLRTVAHLWRQEQQNKNAQEIARRGAELYDKLVGFVDDLKTLGSRLGQAQKSYEDACGKFYNGKGNVIRQAEMLKELGIKPGKSLPAELLDDREEDALD
jgi:DNA recombination protein RmuC